VVGATEVVSEQGLNGGLRQKRHGFRAAWATFLRVRLFLLKAADMAAPFTGLRFVALP
jgi:hypothetical protein